MNCHIEANRIKLNKVMQNKEPALLKHNNNILMENFRITTKEKYIKKSLSSKEKGSKHILIKYKSSIFQ